MKLVLTFDHDEYGKAEDTVEIADEAEARRLLREGNARETPQAKAAKTRRKNAAASADKTAGDTADDNEEG